MGGCSKGKGSCLQRWVAIAPMPARPQMFSGSLDRGINRPNTYDNQCGARHEARQTKLVTLTRCKPGHDSGSWPTWRGSDRTAQLPGPA